MRSYRQVTRQILADGGQSEVMQWRTSTVLPLRAMADVRLQQAAQDMKATVATSARRRFAFLPVCLVLRTRGSAQAASTGAGRRPLPAPDHCTDPFLVLQFEHQMGAST